MRLTEIRALYESGGSLYEAGIEDNIVMIGNDKYIRLGNGALRRLPKEKPSGSTASARDIYDYVFSIHHNEVDFDEGDIGDRIYKYDEYELKTISLSKLNLEEWYADDGMVDEYAEKGTDIPPIVLGIKNRKYTIIDGVHRANAAKKLGMNEIKAWVGVKGHR